VLGAHQRNPNREHVTQGEVDRAVVDLRRVVAPVRRDRAFQAFQRRLAGDGVHRSTRGVAPVQGSLRPAQHLYALEVEHGRIDEVAAVDVIAVDIEGQRLIAALVVAVRLYAAHRQADESEVVDRGEIRRQARDALQIGNAGFVQVVTGKSAHRNRHVLQALLAVLRGNDDFLDGACTCLGGVCTFLGVLCQYAQRKCERRGQYRSRQCKP
jgi:hypothetical protein